MTKLKATIISSTVLLIVASLSTINPASAASAFEKHYDIGKSFLVNQNFDMAIKEFNAALVLSPKNAETLVDRGTAYNGLGKYDLAIKDFSEAMKQSPNSYLAYNNRGVTYLRKGELALSIKDLDRAIEIDPDQPIPYLNRAGASLANGTGATCAEKIAKWLRRTNFQGDYAVHAAILGALGFRQGKKLDEAKALVDDAMAKTDRLKWPYPGLRYLTGKIKGKELLEESEASDYDSTQAHTFIGLKMLQANESKQAQFHFDWVVKNGTKNSVEYWIARSLSKNLNVQPQTPTVQSVTTGKTANPQPKATKPGSGKPGASKPSTAR